MMLKTVMIMRTYSLITLLSMLMIAQPVRADDSTSNVCFVEQCQLDIIFAWKNLYHKCAAVSSARLEDSNKLSALYDDALNQARSCEKGWIAQVVGMRLESDIIINKMKRKIRKLQLKLRGAS